jgi:anti-sigma regulatory factor (Ser/Thr protein kinase)
MGDTRRIRFRADTSVLAEVRAFAASAASDLGVRVDRDDLLLVVGELAANAVIHHGGDAELVIAPTRAGGIRVEVHDGSVARPRLVHSTAWDSEGHRGVFLIEAISERWGTEPTAAGKVVWAELAPVDQRVD